LSLISIKLATLANHLLSVQKQLPKLAFHRRLQQHVSEKLAEPHYLICLLAGHNNFTCNAGLLHCHYNQPE
jgi:hypothetical protein